MSKKRLGFNLIRSGFSLFLILFIFAGFIQPVASVWAQTTNSESEGLASSDTANGAIGNLATENWEEVDWEQTVILPKDLDDYKDEVAKLEREKNFAAIKNLQPVTHTLYSEEAFENFRVPQEIRKLVETYVPLLESKSFAEKNSIKLELKSAISTTVSHVSKPNLIDEPEIEMIDLTNVQKLNVNKTFVGKPAKDDSLQVEVKSIEEGKNFTPKMPLTLNKDWKLRGSQQLSFLPRLLFIPTANAETNSAIIDYYEGIAKNPPDFALYFLSLSQNENGSFGKNSQYEQTAELALILGQIGLYDNDQFQNALDYLINETPKNIREKAIKTRLMMGLNLPYLPLLDDLILKQNDDGGFGIKENYKSDVLTTLQVILALSVANYHEEDVVSSALAFILNQIDNSGKMYFSSGSNPSSYLINQTAAYLQSFRSSTITYADGQEELLQTKIDQLLNYIENNIVEENNIKAIDAAMAIQNFRLYNRNDELQSILTDQLLELQNENGSFDNSTFTTIKSFLAILDSDLKIVSVNPTSSLTNRDPAGFNVVIRNDGYLPASSAKVHVFFDNYNKGYILNFANNGIVLNPGASINLVITFTNTESMIGDTNVKFYAEDNIDFTPENNWFSQNVLFNPASSNLPALPNFFVASRSGINTIKVAWPRKADPNRDYSLLSVRFKGANSWTDIVLNNTEGTSVDGITVSPPLEGDNSTSNWYLREFGIAQQGEFEISLGSAKRLEGFWNFDLVRNPDLVTIKLLGDTGEYFGGVQGKLTDNNKAIFNRDISRFAYGSNNVIAQTDESGNFSVDDIGEGTAAFAMQETGFARIYTKFAILPGQTTENIRIFTTLIADNQEPEINRFEVQFEQDAEFYNQQEKNLLIEATDNISVKVMDFYYYDPATESWNYLGSEESDGSESFIYTWYVPDYILGSGYKLRAIARDYRDNSSVAAEWGPFTVKDGSPPKLSLVSPNGGEEWPLGSTQTIRWNLESVNPLGELRLRANYPNNIRSLSVSTSDNGQRNWVIPNNSYYAGTRVKVEIEGEDSLSYQSGTDESDDYFTIIDNSPAPAAPWATPQLDSVADNLLLEGCSPARMLAKTDSTGRVHNFYHCRTDVIGTPRFVTDTIYRSIEQTDGTSTTPEVVYTNTTETDNNLTGYLSINNLSAVIDSNNNPHLLWLSAGGVGCQSGNLNEIYYLRFNGISWEAAENISLNSTVSSQPALTTTQEGNIHAIWRDGHTLDSNCTESGSSYMAYRRSVENSWFPIVQTGFATNFDYPVMAVTADNKLHLIYSGNDQIYHVTQANSAWSTPLAIAGSQIDYGSLAVSGNSLHYVYNQNSAGSYLTKYLAYSGSAWTQPETLSIPSSNLTRPRIVVNNGSPHILYYANTGQLPFAQLFWTARKNDGTYTTPQRINLASQDIIDPDKIILSYSNNKLLAKWLTYYEAVPAMFKNSANLANFNLNPQPPSFGSLITSKPSIVASGQDVQTVTYHVNNGESVNKLYLSCNHDWHKEVATNPKCFYLEWTTSGGFKKYNNNTVNAHVEVINDGPNASRRVVNPDGSVDFIFNFIMKRSYAGSLNNTVSVITYWDESSAITWKKGSNNFDIQPYVAPPPSFGSLLVSKSSIVSNSQDMQTVTYHVNDGEPVNKLYLACNHDWHKVIPTNPKCFYFEWTTAGGFKEYNATANAHVDLITSGANASRRVVNPDGSVDFIFNFVMKPTYAGSLNNTVSVITYWGDSSYLTWRKGGNNFDIEYFVNPEPNYNSLTATKASIIANGQDTQTITYRVNKGEPVNKLYLACNHDWHKVIPTNPKCFYFEWTTAGGFKEYNATANAHVDLITSGANASRRVVNPDGSVDFIFNFVMKPTYAGSLNNTVSVITYWGDSSYLTWRKGDNNFDIQPQQ